MKPKKKRTVSEATRKRMSEGQRRRWAERKSVSVHHVPGMKGLIISSFGWLNEIRKEALKRVRGYGENLF